MRTKGSILDKLEEGSETTVLSVKKTHVTANDKYMEHKTPNNDENRRALAFLGSDIGNIRPNEKITPQKIPPPVIFSWS